jgi:N-acetylglucosamine kinase-like BadF-type ATPase
MIAVRETREKWWIGVDLGGTWVRVAARDARGRRRAFKGRAPRLRELPALLRRLWRRWELTRGGVTALVVASRGVWTAAERKDQQRRLRGLASRVRVMSDAEAAYHGALGGGPGVLVLAGTGSMALARDARGRWARAGGLGPLLGDEGSAFWIGREWLRASLDLGAARRLLGSADPVAAIAARAPGVLRRARAGRRPARALVARAQDALAGLLVRAARDLSLRAPVTVSWAGSLLGDARLRAGIWRAARRRGLAVAPAAPRESAVSAAARLAARLGSPPRAPARTWRQEAASVTGEPPGRARGGRRAAP